MRLRRAVAIGIMLAASLTALGGCDALLGPTKVAHGQLYQSGDGRYDGYFAAVHQEQVASGRWAEESKASRKPILTALDLRPGTSNATILSATRGKKGDASLGPAVEQTAASELERARRLAATAARLEEMQKRGEELKQQTSEDKKNMGVDKADEKKSAKKDEVKREMSAAVDAVEEMASDARKAAKEAEELAAKLKSAWTGHAEDARPTPDKDKGEKKDDDKPVAKKATPKPETTAHPKKPSASSPSAASPEEKKIPPAQKPPDEVFNP